MKAATYYRYGPPSVLGVEDIPKPRTGNGEVLIRVVASTVNSGDWRLRKAKPFIVRLFFGLFKPGLRVLGTVFSGIVESVGPDVGNYRPGDAVFGISDEKMGAHAEYLLMPSDGSLAHKPEAMEHEAAAALVFGGHTALHFLRQLELSGKDILIYGASGAVGTSAIQLSRHYGARVTAVCSERNAELVRSLGAERVIDYTKEDIYEVRERFDVIYETVNKSSVLRLSRLLKPRGSFIIGAGLFKEMLQAIGPSLSRGIKIIGGVAKTGPEDLKLLGHLATKGEIDPVIDRTYTLDQIREAHEYVEAGHKSGNVVLRIAQGAVADGFESGSV